MKSITITDKQLKALIEVAEEYQIEHSLSDNKNLEDALANLRVAFEAQVKEDLNLITEMRGKGKTFKEYLKAKHSK